MGIDRRCRVGVLLTLGLMFGGQAGALAPPRPALLPSAAPLVEPPGELVGPHLPDLAPQVPFDIRVSGSDALAGVIDAWLNRLRGQDPAEASTRAIRFSTTIDNVGRHSLEIVGAPLAGGADGELVTVQAYQCVQFAGPRLAGAARSCVRYQPVGTLAYHPSHGHFHLDGFATYELRRDARGRPAFGPGSVLSRSTKVGFCLADTTWRGEGRQQVDTSWYRECQHTTPHVPATVRQGISPRWADTYLSWLAGQHLPIAGVPDGIYWIGVTINPPGTGLSLKETSVANNRAFRRIRLSEGGRKVSAY